MTAVRVYTVVSKNPLFKLEALYVREFLKIIYNSAAKPIATLDKHITTVVMQ